jgi:Ca2+-binding EF-hand superfamily protein
LEQAVTKAGGTTQAADALYAKLDPNNTGSVSESQFAQNLPAPGGGHHHHVSDASTGSTDSTNSTDTTAASSDSSTSSSSAIDKFLSFFDTNGDGSISKDELQQGFSQLRSEFMTSLISSQGSQQSQSAAA